MKRLLLAVFALVLGVSVLALAQFQVQPQIDPRVGPIYPTNPSYNFHSQSNYDPYQFNWYTGRWDYVPVPYNSGASNQNYQYSPPPYRPYASDQPPYVFTSPNTPAQQGTSPPSPTLVSPNVPPPANPSPDDSQFWRVPTTQPEKVISGKTVRFEGRIIGIKAVAFDGDYEPHLLLRLKNSAGATGTVDAGQRLTISDSFYDPKKGGSVTATGQLGMLDGHLLLFADTLTIAGETTEISRPGKNAPAK